MTRSMVMYVTFYSATFIRDSYIKAWIWLANIDDKGSVTNILVCLYCYFGNFPYPFVLCCYLLQQSVLSNTCFPNCFMTFAVLIQTYQESSWYF